MGLRVGERAVVNDTRSIAFEEWVELGPVEVAVLEFVDSPRKRKALRAAFSYNSEASFESVIQELLQLRFVLKEGDYIVSVVCFLRDGSVPRFSDNKPGGKVRGAMFKDLACRPMNRIEARCFSFPPPARSHSPLFRATTLAEATQKNTREIDGILKLLTHSAVSPRDWVSCSQVLNACGTHWEVIMTANSVTARLSPRLQKVRSTESTAVIPELSTFMYLAVLAGNPVEHVAARYGVTPTHAAERVEAARLCYEVQVNMPGFPLHLL